MAIGNVDFNGNHDLAMVFRNGAIYDVPFFQRSYSWEAEQWEELWEELVALLNKETDYHYMGCLVLQPSQREKKKAFRIIDGQQRLASFSIIILAVLSRLNAIINGQTNDAAAGNKDRFETFEKQYIGSKDPVSLAYYTKLKLNKEDNNFYCDSLVPLKKPASRFPKSYSQRLLDKALKWFEQKLEALYQSDGEALAKFVETIAEKTFFTVIQVDDESEAFAVFETLNARGVQLAPTDLLKNYLFSIVNKEPDTTAAKKYLKIMEEAWEGMLSTLGADKVMDFIRAYWNSKHELPKGRNLFKTIRPKVKMPKEAFDLVADLKFNAGIYAVLRNPYDRKWEDLGQKDKFEKYLNELKLFSNIKRPFPLLLAVYRKYADTDVNKLLTFLRYVSIITFRYNVICGLETREQEAVYNKAALAVNENNLDDAKRYLRTLYGKVEDSTFKEAFSTKDIKREKMTKYILAELEKDESEGQGNFEVPASVTVEHIFPQGDTHWDDWPASPDLKEHIFRLGNQTLLDAGDNRNLDNSSYDNKKAVYRNSQYKLTSSIPDEFPEWNVENINARQKNMAKRAAQLWRIDF